MPPPFPPARNLCYTPHMLHGRGPRITDRITEIEVLDDRGTAVKWDLYELTEALAQTLTDAEAGFRLEHAVFGLDSLDELRLHQLLVRGLSRRYTVQREVHYPGLPAKRRGAGGGRPRCDLAITPQGRFLRLSDEPDLFSRGDECPPEEALWVEVGIARQYRDAGSIDIGRVGSHRHAVVEDAKRLLLDPRVTEGAVLLIAYTDGEEASVAEIQSVSDQLAQIGVDAEVLADRHARSIPITDRLGHRHATIGLWRVRR